MRSLKSACGDEGRGIDGDDEMADLGIAQGRPVLLVREAHAHHRTAQDIGDAGECSALVAEVDPAERRQRAGCMRDRA